MQHDRPHTHRRQEKGSKHKQIDTSGSVSLPNGSKKGVKLMKVVAAWQVHLEEEGAQRHEVRAEAMLQGAVRLAAASLHPPLADIHCRGVVDVSARALALAQALASPGAQPECAEPSLSHPSCHGHTASMQRAIPHNRAALKTPSDLFHDS